MSIFSKGDITNEVLSRRTFCQSAVLTVAGLFASISGLTSNNESNNINNNGNPSVSNDITGEKIADNRYQKTYLIKKEYCNSENNAFNPLNSFKPEDFLSVFHNQKKLIKN